MPLQENRMIYLQIEEIIRNGILTDIFPEESRAPSTNELARHYMINPATAAKGLNRLVDEGILYKKRGIGMFVSTGAKQKIIALRKAEFASRYITPLLGEAEVLGLTEDELFKLIKETKEKDRKTP